MAAEYTIRKPVLAYSTSDPGVRCSFVVARLSRVEQSAGAFSSTLYLTFIGGARVHWTETRTERRHGQRGSHSINVTENYTSEEIYFNNSVYVIPKGYTETVLPAGDHSFLFTFSIPSNLPSSFEGSFGYIRYTIKATLDRPWKFNQDTKVALTVLAYRDLNMYPQLRTPLILGNTKTICCWCCQSAPMAITARVPFTGVVPGQDVPLIVELDNPTSVDITSVQCYLMQESIFYARGKSRTETRKLGELTLDPVGKHSSHTAQKTMRMPSCPPTLDINCGIIKIHYFIEINYHKELNFDFRLWVRVCYVLQCKATTSGAHMNLYVATPLTVGTVPLIFQQNWEPLPPGQDGPPTVPPTAPPYPDLPPPSYDECVFGAISIREDEDSEHTYGQKQFSPRYPTYNL
uniref:Arrestin C-terminal-like domain-containing protein n=1 Tax=Timema tahoe TaxID=61484 RepID=A0A7R9ILT8_9NEOP|nr:unnamed protein product [Timema tahoe]